MKHNKINALFLLSTFTLALLAGCDTNNNSHKIIPIDDDEEDIVYELGDTVKKWSNDNKFFELPLDVLEGEGSGTSNIVHDFGRNDKVSLKYQLTPNSDKKGTISSDALEKPYFTEDDAKNGDSIELYVYLPANNNLASISLELRSTAGSGYNATGADIIEGTKITVSDSQVEDWIKLEGSYDSLYTLGSIRVLFEAIDASQQVEFYVDDISITYWEETVKTDYVYNDESLYQTYEDYFKVGCCVSNEMLRNTEIRKIIKQQFNSITAENEGKPEQVLDQTACQALDDKSKVAITMKPFEKIYDFAYKNKIKVRHHTFVWYSQTPSWLFTEDYTSNGKQASRELMLSRMDSFMSQMIGSINERWPGLVYAIDVVNEAIGNGGAGYNKNNKWFDTVGDDFVYQAFKCASKYKDEEQDLYYNDYDYDYNTSNCTFALDGFLAKAIEEQLIDGVGIQGHIDCDNIRHDIEDAKLIKAKGLKCQITELDITTSNNEEGLKKQKQAYKDLVSQILKLNESGETNVDAIVVWGITDNLSWKSGQNPLLFTSSFAKKPAYYGFLEAIKEAYPDLEDSDD